MKLIQNIFKGVDDPISVSYKLYGKHRVNFQGTYESEHQKRINELKKKAMKEYNERVGV